MAYSINSSIRAKWYGGIRNTNNIKYIVVHYTANTGTKATAKGNANYFKTTTRKASAHYICDEGNVVYQCVPDKYSAYAVGGNILAGGKAKGGAKLHNICTNTNSLSIEMVSHTDASGNYYIPDQTIENTVELIKDLQKKYPNAKTVCRHFDVTAKACPAPLCGSPEKEKLWQNFLSRLSSNPQTITKNGQVSLIGYVKVNNLNVRQSPSSSAKIIEQMNIGKSIYITERNGDWVKFEDGWVMEKYLTIQNGFETINDIIYELGARKIITNLAYWTSLLNTDINVYCFAKAICNKTVNCKYPKNLNTPNDVLWELSTARKIFTNIPLWKQKMSENNNVYCLAKNVANLTDNR